MLNKFLAWLFQTSPRVIDFVADSSSRYWKKLGVIIPLTIWSAIFYQISPLFIKWQVDTLTEGWVSLFSINLESVLNVFLVVTVTALFLNLLDKVFYFFKETYLSKIRFETESYLENKFLNYLSRFDEAFLDPQNNKRLVQGYSWKLQEIEEKLTSSISQIFDSGAGLIALVFVLPLIHPYLLGLILISVVFDYLLGYLQNQAWRNFEVLETKQSDERYSLRWRIFWNFEQIINNNWFNQINKLYQERRDAWFKTSFNQQQVDRRYTLLKDALNQFVYAVSMVLAGYLVVQGQIELGTFVVFGYYISRFKSSIDGLSGLVRNIYELRYELFRFDFLLNIEPKIDYSDIHDFSAKEIKSIKITDLDFVYPEFYEQERNYLESMKAKVGLIQKDTKGKGWFYRLQAKLSEQSLSGWQKESLKKELSELQKMFDEAKQNKKILSGLNLDFQKGKIYSIVGYNGAGKTTLSKLLKRSIDPTSGEITVQTESNRLSLKNIDPLVWKSYLSSLEQRSLVWDSLTIRDVMLLGMPQNKAGLITDEDILGAIKSVGLGDKIDNLNQVIGEGLEFSGGQEQLLELARMYIQRPPLIILDEGTNQLDAVKEQNILDILNQIKKDSIIIFITHRMTTCLKTDEVIVLDAGKIKAKDTPKELLSDGQKNLFKEFWDIQIKQEI